VFWLGQLLLIGLSLKLNLFPAQGMKSLRESYTGIAYIIDIFLHLFNRLMSLPLEQCGQVGERRIVLAGLFADAFALFSITFC
jgi:ABC-type dipeptide/oligopeptide/nickel transport system permease component